MKIFKKFLILFLLFISALFFTGCDKEKPAIIFSSTPFSKEHGYTPQNTFRTGDKVYYLVYNPKGIESRLIKIQIFKKEYEKAGEFWGYDYHHGRTAELKDRRIYMDYFTVNQKGIFIFQIFEYTNSLKPVIIGSVKVTG